MDIQKYISEETRKQHNAIIQRADAEARKVATPFIAGLVWLNFVAVVFAGVFVSCDNSHVQTDQNTTKDGHAFSSIELGILRSNHVHLLKIDSVEYVLVEYGSGMTITKHK